MKEKGDFKDRFKSVRSEELKKQLFGGGDEDYLDFLKSLGMRRLANGKVVGINDPDE